ncbi:hypothetical protein VTL71DRAFT_13129 [Oculimacula yallundae]|uniref:Major facilitator superfamily (MFS) profile domain-containing protein n=1 Tax=Oculimacula yallundae TaxID=86028 RepID=A0ABR4CPY9_9HELO
MCSHDKTGGNDSVEVGELTFEEDTSGGMGRHLGVFSITFLIIGRIIGSGIFSTPSSITKSTGNVGAAILMWVLGFAISMAGLFVWLEFGCMLPRSGGEKIYLEALYRRPRHMTSILFAVQSVLLGFSATGCITFASNMVLAADAKVSEGTSRGIAGAAMIFVALMHAFMPKLGVKVMNVVGVIKLVIVIFIVVAGWVVLAGGTRVQDPHASFRNAFAGSARTSNPYATALVKVLSSFAGWSNAAYILNEVKNPVRTLKIAGPLAVTSCGLLYVFANISYYAAATPAEVSASGVTVASFFMMRVFGKTASRVLSIFVGISALGNVMTVTYTHARVNQEIAKEGILPFSSFRASTWPMGAPTGGLLLHFNPSIIMITAIPFGDAYSFTINVEGYPRAIVFLAAVVGLFLLRWKKPFAERPFRVFLPVAGFFLVGQSFLLVAPFLRPPGGKGDTSQPYWLYPLVGIGVMISGFMYYFILVHVLPILGSYTLKHEKMVLADGTHVMKPSFSTLVNSDINAFNVEADMALALVASDPNARPKQFRSLFEECIFVFTAMMAVASTTFIQGVIVINTATIGRDLNMTSAQVAWIAAAIGLASGAFMLFFSNTADLFGRKLQLLAGLLFLSFSSLLTSFAPNALGLNVLCSFLGLGTAIIAPPAVGVLFATYPQGKRRNRVTGALGVGNPLGFILGSVSSGIATKYASWRESFMVIAVFFFVMAGAVIWTVPAVPRAVNAVLLVHQFDYWGTLLSVTGLACITAALTEAPNLGWHSCKVILLLVIGVLSLCVFAIWEHHAPMPLLPPDIFQNSTFTMSIICTGLGYMSFITNEFWMSLYMQDIQKLAPLHIAVRLLPQAITGVVWSYLGQSLLSFVSGRVLMAVGGLGYLCGAVLLLFIRPETSYWAFLFPSLCITVIGADFQFIVSNLYISSRLPSSQSSLGAGILQTALRLSISTGLAITSAIYGAVGKTALSDPTVRYSRVFLCTIVMSSLSLLFVPFLRIGRQGVQRSSHEEDLELHEILDKAGSQISIISSASTRHFGGRWGDGCSGADSWEFGNGDWKWSDVDRFEVCLKCGWERPTSEHHPINYPESIFDHDDWHELPPRCVSVGQQTGKWSDSN